MPKTILIAEDSSDSREILKFLLEENGYMVLEAENGREAIETVIKRKPNLILMDIAMPLMDGLEAAKIIRQFSDNTKIPIIAITGYWGFYYRQAKEIGFDDLINKPIEPLKIIPLINRYLSP